MRKKRSPLSFIDIDYGKQDILCKLRPYQKNTEDILDKHKYVLVCWSRRL